MDPEELRHHLLAVSELGRGRSLALTASITASCWPGGCEDRVEPAALPWLRRWQPRAPGTVLPVCSCRTGRCPVCN